MTIVCQQNSLCIWSRQTTLFGTVLQEKVGTIYDHPTNSVWAVHRAVLRQTQG